MMEATSTGPAAREQSLLESARTGDEAAYGALVERHRSELHAHCYRMLGSLHDAEDALQEALLRAWRGLGRLEEGSSLRAWLYRIATNVCLDALRRRPKRVLPIDYAPPAGVPNPGEPLADSIWVEPYPDAELGLEDGFAAPEARYEQREGVELAFIAALQHLPPRQRAVLILREVLGFSAREVAASLDTTVTSVNSSLQRARRTVEERLPQQSQQVTVRALGNERLRAFVERFIDAFERGDVDSITAMLAEDATFDMPPYTSWSRGREAIADSWLMPVDPLTELRFLPAQANGQPAMAAYRKSPGSHTFVPIALDVLTLRDERIVAVTAFRNPELFPLFGLPAELTG